MLRWTHSYRVLGCCLLVAVLVFRGRARAQEESRPATAAQTETVGESYGVQIWVVTGAVPEASVVVGERFLADLDGSLGAHFGGSWRTEISTRTGLSLPAILRNTEPLGVNELLSVAPELLKQDKLIVLGVDWNGSAYQIQAREFDIRVQSWTVSKVFESVRSGDVLARAVGAVSSVFSAIGTIGRPRDGRVEVKMHAGAYSESADSPLMPPPGSLLQVVIRRRKVGAGGSKYSFSTVPWTALQVAADDEASLKNRGGSNSTKLGIVDCQIYSGLRSPLRVRGIRKTDRIAVVIRPRFGSTELRVHAQKFPDVPLSGYQVFAKVPGASTSSYVGQTDWQGKVTLPRDDSSPLKTYYIKHGSLVLARLPIVAGHESQLTVAVHDDSERLQAEGVLKGIQERLVDNLARREIFAARIGQRLETPNLVEEQIEQSKVLLAQMRELPGRNEFIRELQTRQRDFVSQDATTQNRIDRLFRDTRDVITRNLSPDLEQQLLEEIKHAEGRLLKLREYEQSKKTSSVESTEPGPATVD